MFKASVYDINKAIEENDQKEQPENQILPE